jgi:hypothetical protein
VFISDESGIALLIGVCDRGAGSPAGRRGTWTGGTSTERQRGSAPGSGRHGPPCGGSLSGSVVIPAGQCFMLSVLRDRTGTFLAFVPPGEHIPPGQLVRLNTPAGPKLRGRLFLIPISVGGALVPLNTRTLVAAQIVQLATGVRFLLTGLPASVPPIDIHER